MRALVCWAVAFLCFLLPAPANAQTTRAPHPSKRQLEQWLHKYPDADTDKDGVLTVEEADVYRREREKGKRRSVDAEYPFRTEFTFATVSDGVKIALAVGFPRDYDPNDAGRKWPAVFEMMGYPGSTVPSSPGSFGNRYVTVRASLRGAGASGGAIHAISRRNGMDGYDIIEDWIVKQPWSNGKVALHGHSWGGLTGLMVAATNPPHLKAVAVSGLFDDVYRDIGCIGGVRNCGFPVDWLVDLYRPEGPFGSGEAAMQARGLTRNEYDQIVALRPPLEIEKSILWKSLTAHEYQPEFAQASPGTFAAGVRAPIHVMHAYQDEQTGPSGAWIWTYIPDDVPKRLVLSNGNHGDVGQFNRERMRWLDFWTLYDGKGHDGTGNRDTGDPAGFTDRKQRVQVYFETPADAHFVNKPLVAEDFPLPATRWTRYYLGDKQRLIPRQPGPHDTSDSFRVSVGRGDNVNGVYYLLDFSQPTAICGPISASLWIRCSTIDTDLFLMVGDVDSSGTVQLLQRGMLRASHRAIDDERSLALNVDGKSVLVRPRHTHIDNRPLVPGKVYQLDVEIFPVGHVFREGHKLALWIGQPPQNDPVTRHRNGEPSYKYVSAMSPATVEIIRSRERPSSLLLPVLPELPPISEQPLPAGAQSGIFTHTLK